MTHCRLFKFKPQTRSPIRELERYISKSKNSRLSGGVDEVELRSLLSLIPDMDLQMFWLRFAADRAFSATNSVAHWKTREQEAVLKHEIYQWAFRSKHKDAEGKDIFVREELVAHIVGHIREHVDNERAL